MNTPPADECQDLELAHNGNLNVVRALDKPHILGRRLLALDSEQRDMAKGALHFAVGRSA